ncbi:hypothetical protein VDGL01_11205 [Verticillium dahliae]
MRRRSLSPRGDPMPRSSHHERRTLVPCSQCQSQCFPAGRSSPGHPEPSFGLDARNRDPKSPALPLFVASMCIMRINVHHVGHFPPLNTNNLLRMTPTDPRVLTSHTADPIIPVQPPHCHQDQQPISTPDRVQLYI